MCYNVSLHFIGGVFVDILVTLNENYMPQLRVMLASLAINCPGERADIWLLHRAISPEGVRSLNEFCLARGMRLHEVRANEDLFSGAPSTKQYPPEMYFRLLAGQLLPQSLERVLYLDPDILIINSLKPLWETDLRGSMFGACAHTGKTELANSVSYVRLGSEKYYNSGVLLMDLALMRREIAPEELFRYAEEHRRELILPDQDMLNAMFSGRILDLPDIIWNYDARNYSTYFLRTSGEADTDWVMRNTAILHFCGRAKPWKSMYRHRFGVLYKHYMRIAER